MTLNFFNILINIALVFIAGASVIVLCKIKTPFHTWLSKGAIIYGIGVGITSFQMFIYSLVNISFSRISLFLPWIILGLVSIWIKRGVIKFRKINFKSTNKELYYWVFIIILAIVLLSIFLQTTFFPLISWDGWSIWHLKAKVFHLEGSVSNQFLSNINYDYSHGDYPLLFPLTLTWANLGISSYDDQLSKIVSFLFFSGILILFYSHLKNKLNQKIASIFTFLLATTPILYINVFIESIADPILAFYFLGSIIFLDIWITNRNKNDLLLASLFISFGAWTKSEGIIFALVVIIIGFLFTVFKKDERKYFKLYLLASIIPLIINIPWYLYKKAYGIISTFHLVHLFDYEFFYRLKESLIYLLYQVITIKSWSLGIIIILLIPILFSKGKKRKVKSNLYLLIVISLLTACYLVIYSVTQFEIKWLLEFSFPRLLIHVFPLFLLMIPAVFLEKDSFNLRIEKQEERSIFNPDLIVIGIVIIILSSLLGWSSRAVWGLAIIEIIILSVFLLTITRTKSMMAKLPLPLNAFIFFLVLSTVFSVYKYNSILDLVMYMLFIVAFWLVAKFIRNGNQIKIIIIALSSVALISAISGIVNFFQLRDISLGVASFFGWRNIFAGFILLTLPVTFTQFLVERGKGKNIFFGVTTILLSVNLYFTFSQASWIAMAFVLLMLIWFLRKLPVKQLIARFSVVVLISVILVITLLQLHAPLSSKSIQEATVIQSVAVGNRIDYWKTSLEMFADHPWTGVGIGNFETIYTYYQQNVWSFSVSPHNSIFLFLTEMGIFGLIVFLTFLIAIARKAKILLKKYKPEDKSIYYYSVGIFGGIIASFGHSLTDVDWEVPSLFLLWIIEVGLIYALADPSYNKNIESTKTTKSNSKNQILVFTSSLIIGYLIIVPTITDLWNKEVDIIQENINTSVADKSISLLEKAIFFNPLNADLYNNLSESYQIRLLNHVGKRDENQYNIVKYAKKAGELDSLSAKRYLALSFAYSFVSSGVDNEILNAESAIQKSISLNPYNTIYQYQLLGFILQRQEKYDQAIETLDIALNLYNDESINKIHVDQEMYDLLVEQIETIKTLRETIVAQSEVE